MTAESSSGQVKAFNSDDRPDIALWRVDYLKRVSEVPAIRRYKQRLVELIGPQSGERILDVGCGNGEGLRSVHEYAPAAKPLVGIDISQTMIAQATALTPQDLLIDRAIVLRQGDAHNLSFKDGKFDASYSDRTFQHLVDPFKALREMLRVTKSGGRVIVADTDWGSLQVKGLPEKVKEIIESTYFNIIRNPRMGGTLQQLFSISNLQDTKTVKESIELTDLQSIEDVLALEKSLNLAKDNGQLRREDLEECLREVKKAGNEVEASLDIFIVKGIKLGRGIV